MKGVWRMVKNHVGCEVGAMKQAKIEELCKTNPKQV